jgi:hypothetical protein
MNDHALASSGTLPGSLSVDTARAAAHETTLVRMLFEAAAYNGRDDRAVELATRTAFSDPRLAAEAEYAIPRGGDLVTGPSVRLARELARLHGRIHYGTRIVHVRNGTARVAGFAIDLVALTSSEHESEFELKVSRRQKQPDGSTLSVSQRASHLEAVEVINSWGARAERNALLKVLPSSLVEIALAVAADARARAEAAPDAKKAAATLEANKTQALKSFADRGISVEDVERLAGARYEAWTQETLGRLFRLWTSLSEGHAQLAELLAATAPLESAPAKSLDVSVAIGSLPNAESVAKAIAKAKETAEPKARSRRAKPEPEKPVEEPPAPEPEPEPESSGEVDEPAGPRDVAHDYPEELADKLQNELDELVADGREAVMRRGYTREYIVALQRQLGVAELAALPKRELAKLVVAMEVDALETYYPPPANVRPRR